MSNKLNRNARRAEKKNIEKRIQRVEIGEKHDFERMKEEYQEKLEHFYSGLWHTCMAINMRRHKISAQRTADIMVDANRMYGEINNCELTIYELISLAEKEAGMKIQYDGSDNYFLPGVFESGWEAPKYMKNATVTSIVNTENEDDGLIARINDLAQSMQRNKNNKRLYDTEHQIRNWLLELEEYRRKDGKYST